MPDKNLARARLFHLPPNLLLFVTRSLPSPTLAARSVH